MRVCRRGRLCEDGLLQRANRLYLRDGGCVDVAYIWSCIGWISMAELPGLEDLVRAVLADFVGLEWVYRS